MTRLHERHSGLLAVIALGVLLVAYTLVQPHGLADSVMTPAPVKVATADVVKPQLAPQPTSSEAGQVISEDGDEATESLDLPVAGTSQGDVGIAPNATPDIPDNRTLNNNGDLVQPAPPAQDRPTDPDEDVQGAS